MPLDPRAQLKLIEDLHGMPSDRRFFQPFEPCSMEHMRHIELALMVEANDLQQNRNALLDRLDDKLGAIAISLEQVDDQMRSR